MATSCGNTTMKRLSLIGSIVVLMALAAYGQASGTPAPAVSYRTLLTQYCFICNNDKLETAGLSPEGMDVGQAGQHPDVREQVGRKLRTGAMTPVGMRSLEKAAAESLAGYLETAVDRAAEARPNPGRSLIHRLNRAEHANAIHELLGVDIDSTSLLPGDDIWDVLTVSPMLLEREMNPVKELFGLDRKTTRTRDSSFGTKPNCLK